MNHLFYTQKNINSPMLSWEPLRKVEIQVDFSSFWVYKWMPDLIHVQEVDPGSHHGVLEWKVQLKLKNRSLIQPLFDKVYSVPH